MFITVFTPTYNRGYIISKLYRSLCLQSDKNFEWLIVDDGSQDKTEKIIRTFMSENKIEIRYIKQENGGKYRALNNGVKKAKGELFFIVDSDDYLSADAIRVINHEYPYIDGDNSFLGLIAVKMYPNGDPISGYIKTDYFNTTFLNMRYRLGIKGDIAEIYRVSVLRQYPFPETPGENYCPMSLIWDRISLKYRVRFVNKKIYIAEYLPNGITANNIKLRITNPVGTSLYYSELVGMPIPFWYRLKYSINFWRFCIRLPGNFKNKLAMLKNKLYVVTCPIGYLLYHNDKKKYGY